MSASAPMPPRPIPNAVIVTPPRTTSRRTSSPPAPSARRMPISRMRRVTPYDTTPYSPTAANRSAMKAKTPSTLVAKRSVTSAPSTSSVIGTMFDAAREPSISETAARASATSVVGSASVRSTIVMPSCGTCWKGKYIAGRVPSRMPK